MGINMASFWLFSAKPLVFLVIVGEYSSFISLYLVRLAKELVLYAEMNSLFLLLSFARSAAGSVIMDLL